LFHAFPNYVPGGFVGVDVFFVISGFLISGIIFREQDSKSFSLTNFYARRVRRIFPALLVVLAASAAMGWLLLLPDEFSRLGAQIAAGSAFVANIYFWLHSGYFAPNAHTYPLLHLWSLGVEEQFYILWPLIIMALAGHRQRIFSAIMAITLASFLLNLSLAHDRETDFYLIATRAWELMLGAAIAWQARSSPHVSHRTADVCVAAGLALILVGCFIFGSMDPYPNWRAFLPTIGAGLIIWGGKTSMIASSGLRTSSAVGIGRISYPLYLWHWPLLVFAVAFKAAPLTLAECGLVVGASFALAWLTYRFVEIPVRNLRAPAIGLTFGMLAAVLAGFITVREAGFSSRFPLEIQALASIQTQAETWRVHKCVLDSSQQNSFAEECIDKGDNPLLFVWGDSTAAALMPGLRDIEKEAGFRLAQFNVSSCPPILEVDIAGVPNCRVMNAKILGTVRNNLPEAVLLHGVFNNKPDEFDGLIRTIAELQKLNVPRIIVLGPVPQWRGGLPGRALSYFRANRALLPERSKTLVSPAWNEDNARAIIESHGAQYVSAWSALCNNDGCLTRTGSTLDTLIATDEVHLSEIGSKALIKLIESQLRINGDREAAQSGTEVQQ
jgi:peptidoglycan/LPS O-acetylase OafA/YrhL